MNPSRRSLFLAIVLTTLLILVPLAACLNVTGHEESRTSSRMEVTLPTWQQGEWWRYNRTMTFKEGTSTTTYQMTINYTITSNSVEDSGYTCYRLAYSAPYTTSGSADLSGTITGAKHVRVSDLALIRNNYTETGMVDGTTPYNHFYDHDYKDPDYYDFYAFPIELKIGDKWLVDSLTETHFRSGLLGSFNTIRFDNFNLSVEYVTGTYKTVPAGTYFCHQLDGTDAKGQDQNWDKRFYSYGLKNYVYQETKFTYNDTFVLTTLERLEETNVEITSGNSPPELNDPRANPATVTNNDQTTTRLSVEVTDDVGLAATNPVVINLTAIGYGSAVALTKQTLSDRYYVDTTVKGSTAGGTYWLNVSATDSEGLMNWTYIELNVTDINANTPPRVTNPSADPDSVDNSGTSTSLLSVVVTDTNLRDVLVNLSSIGGNATQEMYDDTTHGDVTGGDNRYSFRATIPILTVPDLYQFRVTATDDQDAVNDTVFINLTVTDHMVTNTPPILDDPAATPATVDNSGTGTTLLTIEATDPDEGDVVTVQVDMTQFGGDEHTEMWDDGTHGDPTSGDNVFSYEFTVPVDFPEGTYDLPVRAFDVAHDVSTATIQLSVYEEGGNAPPVIYAAQASPPAVANDGATPVLFEVQIMDDNPEDSHTVIMNLSLIGGEAEQELNDRGDYGDAIMGDGIFSFQTQVPESVTVGTKLLSIYVEDDGDPVKSASSSLELVISTNAVPFISIIYINPPSPLERSNETILIQAQVTDPEGDPLTVTVDLSPLGLSNRYPMKDIGTGGDTTPDDGWFAAEFELPYNVNEGNYTLTVTAHDELNSGTPVEMDKVLRVQMNNTNGGGGNGTPPEPEPPEEDDLGALLLPMIVIGVAFVIVVAVMLFMIRRRPGGPGGDGEEGKEEEEQKTMRIG